MTHILTIDFEDWNQIGYRRATGVLLPANGENLARQMDELLGLLARRQTRATFFVLGLTAQHHPELVRRAAEAGHEIASHGYGHHLVTALSRKEFIEDTTRGKEVVEQITGSGVRGYRAAEFSIGEHSLWALEALAELGFEYDSSIVPARQRRYGIAGFNPAPARYAVGNGMEMTELPLAVMPLGLGPSVLAGGGYFRLMPAGVMEKCVSRFERRNQPAVAYFHPYEFDCERLRIFRSARPQSAGAWWRAKRFEFHQNLGRKSMPRKLERLLGRFRFAACADFLQGAKLSERASLLSVAS